MNETQASQLPVYAGNDLGAVWRSSATAFRLWAPTACSAALHRFATGTDAEPEAADLGTLAMQRSEGGTWYLELAGDLAGQYYQYELQFPDGTSTVTADPYAHGSRGRGHPQHGAEPGRRPCRTAGRRMNARLSPPMPAACGRCMWRILPPTRPAACRKLTAASLWALRWTAPP